MAEKPKASRSTGKRKSSVKPAARKPARKTASRPAPKKIARKKAARKKVAPRKKVAVKKVAVATLSAVLAAKSGKPAKAAPKSVLLKVVEEALADMKAVNVAVLDVRGLTDVADSMVIASGNSDRHVRAIADNVAQAAKKAGFRPLGMEGERDGEWALVDLQDVVVHVMLQRVREFYRLESLWDISAARREAAQG